VAHNNGIDLEGACEASLACSTCHVILEEQVFDSLDELEEEEEDLLDLAYGLTHTSRLGCQVMVTPDMANMVVKLPSATRNFYVDKTKLDLPNYDKK
jgi:ferredoxin